MSADPAIGAEIHAAADAVGAVWPLHSFVTANPLAGLEDRPFDEAVDEAARTLGGDGYPSPAVFRRAWESDRISSERLRSRLSANGYDPDPEATLDRMAAAEPAQGRESSDATDRVDAVLTKWLAAFLDQGRAEWSMPGREQGFYAAFRRLAPHDDAIPNGDAFAGLSDDPLDAVRTCLAGQPTDRWRDAFEFHLTALPGWTGLIKRRADDGGDWQSAHPITLPGYLAVRLTLADAFDAPLVPPETSADETPRPGGDNARPLPAVWLSAWEATYRAALVESVTEASASIVDAPDRDRPDAQLVFCIDTRSEIIRRHIEAAGRYETHGYAGFFGVPMRYAGYDSDVTVDACPPILDAKHHIADRPASGTDDERDEHARWHAALGAATTAVENLTSNAATAFSFVESTGLGYGAALAARTLRPTGLSALRAAVADRVPDAREFCVPSLDHDPDSAHELPEGLTLEEKTAYAATAFELMGIESFARVVVFAGHASQTTNNPFDASLDCGACAGNPGGPSARVLAAICNDDAVRTRLRERGIDVPDDTHFVAGEHNTTTDEVELYTATVPASHEPDIERLRADLATARAGAAGERAGDMGATVDSGVRETRRRAADWAETRPEWGLAGNAGFVIGPSALTDGLDLDGRAFLHSYDWTTDPDGDALETILTGPLVVTQWINAQYYFATVDNAVYGSGSKVTHNPVGNVGVYQGNGGDLMSGLPAQSLMGADGDPYHQPLRLSAVVHAPVERVTAVLSEHETLAQLFDNGWLSLTVVDPEQDHRAFRYGDEPSWSRAVDPEASNPPATD